MLGVARHGQVEGVFEDAVDALAGEHGLLDHRFLLRARVDRTAHFGVFALDILAHHVEIDVAGLVAMHRRGDAGQQPHGTQIDVLVEIAPDRDQQSPERHMIRYARKADGAEKYRIVSRSWSVPSSGIIRPVLV